MAFKKTFRGVGPTVYFEMNHGSNICRGTNGTAKRANCSLGTPASISFRPVTESVAANPICEENVQVLIITNL